MGNKSSVPEEVKQMQSDKSLQFSGIETPLILKFV